MGSWGIGTRSGILRPVSGAPPSSLPPVDPDEQEPSSDETSPDEPKVRLSYRERRQESDALAELARVLVDLTPSRLADVPLPDEVRKEIEVCRGFRKGPRIRQLRRISQMLRRLDVDEVREATDDAANKRRRRAERERIYEHWRERLCAEGDEALAELVEQHPSVDRQRLRQLLRQAGRDPESPKAKRARRDVLRVVREAFEADGQPG